METPLPLGYWLTLVDRLIEERFAEVLEEHGVTRRQWELLNVLTDQSLAREDLTDDPDGQVTELVDSGWVTLQSDVYTLTEQGQVARDGLRDAVARLQTRTTEGLSAKEYDATVAALGRMAKNLGWDG